MELKVYTGTGNREINFDWKIKASKIYTEKVTVKPNQTAIVETDLKKVELFPPVYTYIVSTTTNELLYTSEGRLYEDDVVTKYSIKKGTFKLSYNRETDYEIEFEPISEMANIWTMNIHSTSSFMTIDVKNKTSTDQTFQAGTVFANIVVKSYTPEPQITKIKG